MIPFTATMPAVMGSTLSIDMLDNNRIAAANFGDHSYWIDIERGAIVPDASAPAGADRSAAVLVDDGDGKIVLSPTGVVARPYSSRRAFDVAGNIDALPEARALAKRMDLWEPIDSATAARVFASRRQQSARIAIVPLAEQAWIAWLPDGRAELLGNVWRAREAAHALLSCKRGDEFTPLSPRTSPSSRRRWARRLLC